MNKLYLILAIVFVCSLGAIQAQDKTVDLDRIYWNDWYRLEWSDFTGVPNEGATVAALSSIGLPYKYSTDGEGELKLSIDVCFLKKESWSKSELRNNLLLQHEQIHFDIAELHRRKIVKAFLETSFTKKNYKEKLNQIIDKIWKEEYKIMQDQYDKESGFSKVIKEQIRWNKFIDQELKNYKDYAFNELELSLINFD